MPRDMKNRAEWARKNLKAYTFKLHKVNDKDVIDHLERQPNKRAYVIELIKKDMGN